MNETIVKRIKDARIKKGLTQKDLADHLGRTAAAISDLERGKVQVTASDLYKIAQYLRKPIEFFFGEEFGGEQIQDLVTVLREQSPEARDFTIKYMKKLIRLQILGEQIISVPKEDIAESQMKEFLELLVDITKTNKDASRQIEETTRKVLTEIEFKGIDFRQYLEELS